MGRMMEWIVPALTIVAAAAATLWVTGAVYYDLCRGTKWGQVVAAGWATGVVVLFVAWQPLWRPFAVLVGVTGLFLVWWLRLKPSHHRIWDPSVAVLPRAVLHEDALTLENVRNFQYRSLQDFTPRYETRQVRLSSLRGADIILFNWGSRWMSHPVLVFDFGADGRICISIEVRYRNGQSYSVVRSFYRQQELIFLVVDERDAILRRTKYGPPQTARLYHLTVGIDVVRSAFLDYIGAINDLYEKPRWYHGLCANCTTSFYRLPSRRLLRDCRVIANGQFDRALYENGQLDRSLPFDDLQQLALINDIANECAGSRLRRPPPARTGSATASRT